MIWSLFHNYWPLHMKKVNESNAAASLTGPDTPSTPTTNVNYRHRTRTRAERLRIASIRSASYAWREYPIPGRTSAQRYFLRVKPNSFRDQSINVHQILLRKFFYFHITIWSSKSMFIVSTTTCTVLWIASTLGHALFDLMVMFATFFALVMQ